MAHVYCITQQNVYDTRHIYHSRSTARCVREIRSYSAPQQHQQQLEGLRSVIGGFRQFVDNFAATDVSRLT